MRCASSSYGSFLSESFFPNFSTFFSRDLSIFHIFLIFFSNCVKFNKLDFIASGEFHVYIVTERLRILIYISNYFQTLDIMGKTLSHKNERVVVMCTLLFSMFTTVCTAPWSHGISAAPPRVEVVSGLVEEDIFLPSRRFHEDGLEALKLSTGGGAPE